MGRGNSSFLLFLCIHLNFYVGWLSNLYKGFREVEHFNLATLQQKLKILFCFHACTTHNTDYSTRNFVYYYYFFGSNSAFNKNPKAGEAQQRRSQKQGRQTWYTKANHVAQKTTNHDTSKAKALTWWPRQAIPGENKHYGRRGLRSPSKMPHPQIGDSCCHMGSFVGSARNPCPLNG